MESPVGELGLWLRNAYRALAVFEYMYTDRNRIGYHCFYVFLCNCEFLLFVDVVV